MGSNLVPTCPKIRTQFLQQYFNSEHIETVERLVNYGISEIKPFRTERWYIGEDSEGTIRKYYMASYCGEACFVKLAKYDSTIKNEIFVNNYIACCDLSFVPRTLTSDIDFGRDESMLVTQYISGLSNFQIPEDTNLFDKYCDDFIHMHGAMQKFKIIHSDINDTNLLLNSCQQMILTDFGIGKAPGTEVFCIDYEAHDGTFYVDDGDLRTYDDAYSFVKMLDKSGIASSYKGRTSYKKVLQLVGLHQNIVRLH